MNKYKVVFKQALIITIPVFLGYMAIGIAFGLMLVTAGYPWWLAPIMSIMIYAGAGQYVAVPLFATNAGLGEIAMITLLVNSRHIVYGLSLIEKFRNTGIYKLYMIFALTDETYGLLTTIQVENDVNTKHLYFFISFLDHFYWVLGGLIGAVIGSLLPYDFKGLDFALTALFIVLLIEQIKKCNSAIPLIISFISAILSFFLVGKSNMLLISILISIAGITIFKGRLTNEKSS
ncbi:MAG: hypothetical protein A2015_17100 [Spirochaetes bacterium GWF1_31_7]|nr:MAG: hypothetical protein A2Y30_14465 [Spirochaetes bacterium GWE1_32_154]OHD50159.1 MAG: hypothetical protein A2Y29_12510 [Spirochaetes bacterium GWE2_31_10]OHD52473.1 MAG: hypothetical protein A2015_17100 [Spirochaetes bacterium GWF1_31_7]HBD94117.1 branched-chain amino acid ABC transporter permease [Spirochaetia bacterium]HBI38630.1 branched-chain amino acid ABC transporter permease [Spirochaetia bacterium]